ncbi:hypothetical protein GBO14_09050 [Pseudoalteromonas shioyasakiensis]|uniref:hypothetical protein n=1 Tax=Pseudoalteromonas shioyasakiensis TaxID=1190813 RepID=UPI002094D4A4|nr:hypothetical protein [Pseudoalteromonas shioyasakiensis]MCO6354863.1 hypothetical protein [Pseudoalteromonas shioyasakiensis]
MSNKRKALRPSRDQVAAKETVEPLRIEDMVIKVDGRGRCYFKRLKYRGCPDVSVKGQEFKKGLELIDAGRDDFVRECYRLMSKNVNSTTLSTFYGLTHYLKWVDATNQQIPEDGCLASELIDTYMKWCQQQDKLGKVSKADFSGRKRVISWLLRQTNRTQEAAQLPTVKGLKTATRHHYALDLESELKPTVKALFRAYNVLLKHFNEKTTPDRHPLYEEELVEKEAAKRKLKGKALGVHRAVFKTTLRRAHPNNIITKVAMMLTYMFTGMNTKPLAGMRIADVSFKEVQGGNFILNSVKGRAGYQQQDNAMGFSTYAKRFIESWLNVAKVMAEGDEEAYLFPYFTTDNKVVSYNQTQEEPYLGINKLLARMGLTEITPSKLRKTKSDALYRVTESVYLVAMSNNNSMEVTARTYIHGTKKEHENNLSAAMKAKLSIVRGQAVNEAVEEAKFYHGDILDDYEYQRLRKDEDRSHEARTPTGTRCNDNRKGAASIINKSLKKAGVTTDKDEEVCTDFLQCFNCEEHAFVTDVDDIWLMLSFKETLQQLLQTPSINSMPERKYTDLLQTINSVLEGFKEKNKANYNQALEVSKEKPHPLYSNVYSLNDLLEIFG